MKIKMIGGPLCGATHKDSGPIIRIESNYQDKTVYHIYEKIFTASGQYYIHCGLRAEQ